MSSFLRCWCCWGIHYFLSILFRLHQIWIWGVFEFLHYSRQSSLSPKAERKLKPNKMRLPFLENSIFNVAFQCWDIFGWFSYLLDRTGMKVKLKNKLQKTAKNFWNFQKLKEITKIQSSTRLALDCLFCILIAILNSGDWRSFSPGFKLRKIFQIYPNSRENHKF